MLQKGTVVTTTPTQAPLELAPVVGGSTRRTGSTYEVRSPYDDALVAVIHRAGPDEIEAAIAGAVRGVRDDAQAAGVAGAPRCSAGSPTAIDGAREDDFARTIALEAGKPIKTARVEAERAAFTFRVAAEETKRIHGEIVQLDWLPGNEGRTGHVRRVPLGPIAGISPFNFPLNLVAHKVAPALAAGNPIVVRPACQTPISALKLAQIVLEAGWPEEGIAVVPSTTADAAPLVEDERIKLLTFTGSPAVGWDLKSRAGHEARHARARRQRRRDRRCRRRRRRTRPSASSGAGTSNAGQTCISVQRVYVTTSRSTGSRTTSCAALRARSWSATRSTRRPTSAR